MPDRRNSVVPEIQRIDEERFQHAFVGGMHRLIGIYGKSRVAAAMGCSDRHLANIYAGTMPNAAAMWNLRTLDATALDEVAALQGARVAQQSVAPGNDYANIAELANATARYAEAMADGVRDHAETLALADLLRPLIAKLVPIVSEADRHKGVH